MRTNRFCVADVRLVTSRAVLEQAWLYVADGVICALGCGEPPDSVDGGACERIDGGRQWLVPGFIDLHAHGGGGADVMEATESALQTVATFHAAHGTTAWLPTTVTAPVADLLAVIAAVERFRRNGGQGAVPLGVHLEGPFLSAVRAGAQNPRFLQTPSLAVCDTLVDAVPGLVRKMTLAPELPGTPELIRRLLGRGVIPSLGHTDATYAECQHALSLGHCHGTHLFNAMRGIHHREAGAVGALLTCPDAVCELIADGVHVSPPVLRLAFRQLGPDRLCLVTDAIAAAGRPDGVYALGGLSMSVESGLARLADGGQLAGSTLTMDGAFRNAVSYMGASYPEAVRMTSTTPARELGLAHRKGDIAVGMDADLVLLDASLQVVRTWVGGREVFRRPAEASQGG